MHTILKTLLIAGVLLWSSLDVAYAVTVNCNQNPNASVQDAVDNADGPTTIDIKGLCVGDVTLAKDDITLSGRPGGSSCNKANPGGSGTIEGTITVKSVRARIEFLTITGPGGGVEIEDRATVDLTCNDISDNAETGVAVVRSSNAVLRDNTLSGNGTRAVDPFIFNDCGLYVAFASSVHSLGNTYTDNQYCAIEADTQSTFTNGQFLPHESGHPADPNERDTIVQRDCDPTTGTGCLTNNGGPVAVEVWNGGLFDVRNADISGEIEALANSSFRVDGDATVQGNIFNDFDSLVRIKDRSDNFGDRLVTYSGTLTCDHDSKAFYSEVQCGQTCSGAIPGTCGF